MTLTLLPDSNRREDLVEVGKAVRKLLQKAGIKATQVMYWQNV